MVRPKGPHISDLLIRTTLISLNSLVLTVNQIFPSISYPIFLGLSTYCQSSLLHPLFAALHCCWLYVF